MRTVGVVAVAVGELATRPRIVARPEGRTPAELMAPSPSTGLSVPTGESGAIVLVMW